MLLALLNVPLRQEFGIDALTLNVAYAVATVAGSLPLAWLGGMTDRVGPRKMMMLLAVALGGACLFTATVEHIAMVFIAFFLLRSIGQGAIGVVSHHAVAMWFHRRLGTVLGSKPMVGAGSGAASAS